MTVLYPLFSKVRVSLRLRVKWRLVGLSLTQHLGHLNWPITSYRNDTTHQSGAFAEASNWCLASARKYTTAAERGKTYDRCQEWENI